MSFDCVTEREEDTMFIEMLESEFTLTVPGMRLFSGLWTLNHYFQKPWGILTSKKFIDPNFLK